MFPGFLGTPSARSDFGEQDKPSDRNIYKGKYIVGYTGFKGAYSNSLFQTATWVLAPAAPASTPPELKPQPSVERSTPRKPAKAKQPRSMKLDLRHYLELESNAAIAKCAGEE
jgi:hypothetical protein